MSIVAFKKGQLRVLSHAWDRNLGGRDLDNVLFEHFAQEFQEKYKLDVHTNLRGSFRLRMACEKVGIPAEESHHVASDIARPLIRQHGCYKCCIRQHCCMGISVTGMPSHPLSCHFLVPARLT